MVDPETPGKCRKIEIEHSWGFQGKKDSTWAYGGLKLDFCCHVVFLLAITHSWITTSLFSYATRVFFLSRLSLISYAYKDIDTKLSTVVAGIRFLLMQSTTIPSHRDLSVYANCRYYCLLFKSSSCNTPLLFPCSPCTGRLCKLTVRLYCFSVPWKARQAAGLWPNDTDSCQCT